MKYIFNGMIIKFKYWLLHFIIKLYADTRLEFFMAGEWGNLLSPLMNNEENEYVLMLSTALIKIGIFLYQFCFIPDM